MKKIVVKGVDGVQIAGAEMEDPTQWIADCVAGKLWGEEGTYSVEIEDISQEHTIKEVIAKRIAEYPTPAEFLNAFFDGGLEELREKRLLVKEKYPKP
jgi:hypothetical protein